MFLLLGEQEWEKCEFCSCRTFWNFHLAKRKGSHVIASCISLEATCFYSCLTLLSVVLCCLESKNVQNLPMENVLKNILVVPFLFETTTRDVKKTDMIWWQHEGTWWCHFVSLVVRLERSGRLFLVKFHFMLILFSSFLGEINNDEKQKIKQIKTYFCDFWNLSLNEKNEVF